MIRNEVLACLSVILVICCHISAEKEDGNLTKIPILDTVIRSVKAFFAFLGSFFPKVTTCNYDKQPILSCYNCHQVMRCLPANVGFISTCVGFFKYCRNGRCSRFPTTKCSPNNTSTTKPHKPPMGRSHSDHLPPNQPPPNQRAPDQLPSDQSSPGQPPLVQLSPNYLSPNQPSPNQPSPNQPSPNQPSPNQPSPDQPPLDQPSPKQPSPNRRHPSQPSPNQPPLDQRPPDQPSPDQPSLNQPFPDQPSPNRRRHPSQPSLDQPYSIDLLPKTKSTTTTNTESGHSNDNLDKFTPTKATDSPPILNTIPLN